MTSEEIKDLRKQLKLTQEGFANALKVDFKTVNRWENGRARPSNLAIRQLQRLARKCANNDTGSGDTHRSSK